MDLIKKTFIIFAICFLGNIISKCLPFPFPGSVLAMILLFVCLVMRAIKPKQIESVADFLLKVYGLYNEQTKGEGKECLRLLKNPCLV